MITAGDFRNGVTFEMDGNVVQVVEFQHVKPGKGAAFVRTKYKNVITGAVVEQSFNPTAKFPTAFVERKDMEYLYNDGDMYYFMDSETYEQTVIEKDKLGPAFAFVKENTTVKVLSYLKLLKQTQDSRAIQQQMQQNLQHLKQVQKLKYLSLSTLVTRSRLIQEQVSIWNVQSNKHFFI